MRSQFFRLVAACLFAVLTLVLFVQSPAFAIGGDGDGRAESNFSPGRPSRGEVLIETIKPSVANPEGSQPRPGQSIESFRNEQVSKEFDRASGGRDVSRNNASGERQETSRREGKSAA
jgi:hypothetical protein